MTDTETSPPVAASHRCAREVEIRALAGNRSLLTLLDGRNFLIDWPTLDLLDVFDALDDPHAGKKNRDASFVSAVEAMRSLLAETTPPTATPAASAQDTAPATQPTAHHPGRTSASRGSISSWAEKIVIAGDPEVTHALTTAILNDPGGERLSIQKHPGPLHSAVHQAFSWNATLMVTTRGADSAGLIDTDRLCADARITWLPASLERNRLRLGPLVAPGVGASYEDYIARRIAASPNAEVERSLLTPSITGDAGSEAGELSELFGSAARELLTGQSLARGDTVVDITDDASVETHPVLPLPGSDRTFRAQGPTSLIDPHTGLITRTRRISHHPSVPRSLATVQADVCTLRRVARWANNTSCQGSAFADPSAAEAAAIGEAVERYCGNILDTLPVEYGSYDQLITRGIGRVLDPDELILYSDGQYQAPGFPFVPMTHDLPIHWVPGESLTRGEPVWVPASMVYVNWFTAGHASAPVTNFCPFAGIAAGPTREYATMSALEEIIERHATMVWWLNSQPLDALRLDHDLLSPWQDSIAEHDQQPGLIALDNEFAVPVAAGVLYKPDEQLLNIGFSARHDIGAAAKKAWTEALTLQEGSRDLLPEDGRHWVAMRRGDLNGRSFKPWRQDRRYLDDFREDMHDCDDLMVQQQVHLDPRAHAKVSHLVERPTTREIESIASLPARNLAHYQARVEEQGLEVIVVDITSPDVSSTGLSAVRVIVPGTIGNAPAAFPFLGQGRVQQIAVELGWRQTPLPEADLNYFPLPHA